MTDALICQLEVPVDTVATGRANLRWFFCVNLAPAKRIDVAVLQRADLVVVNETESAWYGNTLRACTGLVATTRGSGTATLEQDGEVIAEAAPPTVTAVDTTGAGDTFTAALTVALVEGQEPAEALRLPVQQARLATTKMGAQSSLPGRDEVENYA